MTRRLGIDDLASIATPENPVLSPDGAQVAYVLRTVDVEEDRDVRRLFLVGVSSGEPRPLTRGPGDSAPAWSPDGASLAFLRADGAPPQVWLLPAAGGEAEQVTHLPLGAGAPSWSPDGTALAFTAPLDLAAEDGEDDAARERRGRAPVVTDRLDYQADGAGLLGTVRSHVHVLDLASRACRALTRGDWHAGEPAWSPDGSSLAFAAGTAPDADVRARAAVHVVEVPTLDGVDGVDGVDGTGDAPAPPEEVRTVGLEDGAAGTVAWTRDGSALVVVGEQGAPGGQSALLRVGVGGGEVVDLAAALDRSVMAGAPGYPGAHPVITADGADVLFCARDRGRTHLFRVPVDGSAAPTAVLDGAGRAVSGLSVVGRAAATVLTTPVSFGEVAVLDLATGAVDVRTRHGAALGDVEPFVPIEREVTVSDGTVVHGWLLHDPDAAGAGPLLVDAHGGPHNAWTGLADAVHLYQQELVAKGWSVLMLNPRGSDGYGAAFHDGAIGAWGVEDAKDFLEPVDALVAEGVADPDRLAVAGYSYGGYVTCYLTGVTDRFAAAVTGGVVADVASLNGTSDVGHHMAVREIGAQPWEEPQRYAALSPIERVGRVSTPTLVLQGAEDVRCPVGQAQHWFSALRARGVPTRLVLYPGASHLFIVAGLPSHRLDWNRRTLGWLEQHAGAPSAQEA